MEKQQYNIRISATPDKVWNVLWGAATYPAWTAAFSEGGSARTDWKEGSKVVFVDGSGHDGMVSLIAKLIPNEYMSFRHLGYVKDGVEDLDSPEVKAWAGAEENYTLRSVDGQTELLVDSDTTEDHAEFFRNAWPKAMQKIKELSEQH